MTRAIESCRRAFPDIDRLPRRIRVLVLFTALALPATAFSADFSDWVSRRDTGVVRQEREYSCGVAALATYLTHYWGQPVSEASLLALLVEHSGRWALPADWREQGVSWRVLQRMAGHFGLQAAGLRVSPELLFSLRVPALVRLQVRGQAHFSLLRGVDSRGRVQLADPSWGNQILRREAFLALWASQEGQGSVMLLHPGTDSGLLPRNEYFGVRSQRVNLKPPPA